MVWVEKTARILTVSPKIWIGSNCSIIWEGCNPAGPSQHCSKGSIWIWIQKSENKYCEMGMGQNPVPLVNIKIAGKWMFIPLIMVLIGIDSYPNDPSFLLICWKQADLRPKAPPRKFDGRYSAEWRPHPQRDPVVVLDHLAGHST